MISCPARTAVPRRPLTPRQRAAVRKALAAAIGDGQPASRHDVTRDLFGARPSTPAVKLTTPDTAVGLADAAARLGVSVNTVKRYLAPSSGKLRRLGDGVSLASLQVLAGGAK
jgi:hypothetical protein